MSVSTLEDSKPARYFLSIGGDQHIVGSANDPDVDHFADVDLMETKDFALPPGNNSKEVVSEHILKLFQEKFAKAYASKNTWITDFKCGQLPGGEAIRWNRETIAAGVLVLDRKQIFFTDCLQTTSRIKMDIIYFKDNNFIEVSDIYLISMGDFTTYNPELSTTEAMLAALRHDSELYYKEGNPYKAVKRLYSYAKLIGNELLRKKLLTIINELGPIYMKVKDEDIAEMLMTQKFRPLTPTQLKIVKKITGDGVNETEELKQLTENAIKKYKLTKWFS
jgi:hypothetical protein